MNTGKVERKKESEITLRGSKLNGGGGLEHTKNKTAQ